MEYFLAFQLLCGLFAAFVAARKGRSALVWFALGLLLPIVGVVLALRARPPRVRTEGPRASVDEAASQRQPPRRCCGSYIPDCLGCPFFTRPLFDPSYEGPKKGYCQHFENVLVEEGDREGSPAVSEE
jgi:hypothetical protein